MGDPYAKIVEMMAEGQSASPCRVLVGRVSGVEPLFVSVGGLALPSACLKAARGLELAAGDQVVMLTEDQQIFYVLCAI
jgi:hypothetical protein